MRDQLEAIIGQLQAVHTGKLWMGDNFMKKIRDVSEQNAFVRPLENVHSIAEIVSHLNTWRFEAILKVKTGKGSLTDEDEANWYSRETLLTKGWPMILQEFEKSNEELIGLLGDHRDAFLDELYYDNDFKGNYPYRFLLEGMIHHDIYHLGQIGLIMKLLKQNGALSVSKPV